MATKNRSWRKQRTTGEIILDFAIVVLMCIICFITIYPIWYVVVNSFNDGADAMRGGIFWWPRVFSLENYKTVFKDSAIISAFGITIARTITGTVLSVLFTSMVAYGLSKTRLVGRKIYLTMGIITMMFHGGLIPTFLLYKNLNLLDHFLVFVIPAMFSFYNAIIFMSFFREIPASLEESAQIDGANDLTIFFRMILPLSKPVLATIALFNGVYHWNDYFSGVIYINTPSLQPIQTYLYRMVAEAGSNQMAAQTADVIKSTTSMSLKLATMVVTTLPIVCVYPFLQKYFVKGMMIGAVKG